MLELLRNIGYFIVGVISIPFLPVYIIYVMLRDIGEYLIDSIADLKFQWDNRDQLITRSNHVRTIESE